jgi:Rod binding domain-containing protein
MLPALNLNHSIAPQGLYLPGNTAGLEAQKANASVRIQKLKKVAQDFEGILLASLLDEAQKGSLDPSPTSLGAGSETLRSLGSQAVAQALAERGGVGIARMIVHHFSPKLQGQGLPAAR